MNALVLGAGGFIGNHLVSRLKQEGFYVKGIDLKHPEFKSSEADEFIVGDLRDFNFCKQHFTSQITEIYQLAADMGGAGYLFSGDNDYNVVHNSSLINLNVSKLAIKIQGAKLFFASSACIYPKHNQLDANHPNCSEESAYPAEPDSEYGWEKLMSERLYLSAARNYGLCVKIARFHNVYGPYGVFNNGKEKAPAALCRKVAEAANGSYIELWGSGEQTRSFLYIDDCLDGIRQLMQSDFSGPVNIGSEEIISLRDFANLIITISGKRLSIKSVNGPIGVNGRTSDNTLANSQINWHPKMSLSQGISQTYHWIQSQVESLQETSRIK